MPDPAVAPPAARPAGWPRAATVSVFFIHGLLFASWTAHIPQVKDHAGLTVGALGLALLGAPAGSVSAMLASARLLPRLGSRRMVRACLIGYCATGPLVGLAGSLPALFAALFAWGVFQGSLDVSMNTQAVTVERARARPLMSGFHGCWSIGTLAGAAAGVAGVALGVSLTAQLLLLGAPALMAGEALSARMLPDAGRPDPGRPDPGRPDPGRPGARRPARRARRLSGRLPRLSWPLRRLSWPLPRLSGPVLVLGAIAFASMLCEGASADWASVFLRGPVHAGAAVAGLGYTAYSLTMVIVRLSGNRLLARRPVQSLLPALAAVALAGFVAGLADRTAAAVIGGFACLGIGLALIVPTTNSAAGRLPGLSPGAAIAAVSTCGWLGFVCGPPLIGALASATSLPLALGVIPALVAFIAVATAVTRQIRAPGPAGRQRDPAMSRAAR
jgi:MFS family permease